VASLS